MLRQRKSQGLQDFAKRTGTKRTTVRGWRSEFYAETDKLLRRLRSTQASEAINGPKEDHANVVITQKVTEQLKPSLGERNSH